MENNKHFLEWITVEEFKCFSNFHAKGFKRVNLIGGKNNVGKTALMEAVFINAYAENINKLLTAIDSIKKWREQFNQSNAQDGSFITFCKKYESESTIKHISYELDEADSKKIYKYKIGKIEETVNSREFSYTKEIKYNIFFIRKKGISNSALGILYQTIQKFDKEGELNGYIKEFDDTISSFKFIADKPQCKVGNKYRDITEFGDGLSSYISIICGLHACQNGYLFIDEVDNGIYYEHFDRLWEIILMLSKEMNCQVFATTHSKEMLESFARVAKKLEEEDVSYTLLLKNKEQELKTISYDYEMLEYSMLQEHEVR